jgi:sodium-dependent dicarboxylate transporter 2/3/5
MQDHKEIILREKRSSYQLSASTRKIAVIGFALFLFILIRNWLPLDEAINDHDTASIRTGLAILALAAVLWLTEAMPLALTAILIPVIASLTGVLDVSESFAGFAHPLIFLFLGSFGLAAALSKQGLDRWLAINIVGLGRGNFHVTALALFMVSAALSMWITNTATVALMLPVALGILSNISIHCDKSVAARASTYLLLGIAYSASIGGMGTLIGTAPNAIAAAHLKMDFTQWLRIGLPAVMILLPLLFILLRLLINPGEIPRLAIQKKSFKFNNKRILTLAVFLLTICAWLSSSHLAVFFGISKSFDTIIAVSAVLTLGGGLTLSKILGVTGASLYLAREIQTIATDWPVILLVGAVVLFMIFLTELSSNTASTALLVPIFATVAIDMNIPVKHLVLPLTLAASCAFMLPIATPPNALVFSSGKIQQRDMIRIGLVLNLVFAVILTLFARTFL